jgi:hypothetical protein
MHNKVWNQVAQRNPTVIGVKAAAYLKKKGLP